MNVIIVEEKIEYNIRKLILNKLRLKGEEVIKYMRFIIYYLIIFWNY